MTEVQHTKCKGCGCHRANDMFLNNAGRRLKTCSKCRSRRHKCPKCDYKCSYKSHLRVHITAIHDKINDFKCDKCDYVCSQNSNLQRHIKTCTGELTCSAGEFQIMKTLDEMGMPYEYNQSHELKSDKGWLRWDFIIQTTDDPLFIEYDGKQHFEPVRFGGISEERALKAFERQKKYDKLKNDYCDENGYLLLRIPYTEYENIHAKVVEFIRTNTDWGYE